MKKKIVLIATLAIALILPLAISVEKADADAILFPWVTKSATVSTVLSVINTAQGDGSAEVLHYQYWYKQSTANGQTEVCDNISFKRSTSKDDIVTFDAAGNMNGGQALFSDPGAGTWKGGPSYGSARYDLNVTAPRRAFLIVDNNTDAFVNDATNEDGTMYGEAMMIEIAGGAAWGYIAYNASGGEGSSQNGAVRFDDGLDVLGEVIGITETTQTVLLPPDTITTRFFMTPVETTSQRDGDADSGIQLCIDPDNAGGCDEGGIYDNDENKIDFEKEKAIRCTSGDDLEDLMTEASFNTFSATGGQGWSYIITFADSLGDGVDSDGMIIGKLEFTTTGVTLDGTTVPGTLNNFVWLRDNESIVGEFGINDIHNCVLDTTDALSCD